MTIPQIASAVGWTLFTIALGITLLHTVNLAIPGVDLLAPTSRLGLGFYLVTVPATIVGLVIGILGYFGERIEEWWLEKQRNR